MRYLVVADIHGHLERLKPLTDSTMLLDGVIGAGDFYRDGQWLADNFGVPYYGAQGNNDHEETAPWITMWAVDHIRFGVIHGHQWVSSRRQQGLWHFAESHRLDIVIFGHTHRRQHFVHDETIFFNPGSVFRPRGFPPGVGWIAGETKDQLKIWWEDLPFSSKT